VLGVCDGREFKSQTIPFIKNDTIVLYTDGITEALNARLEEYGFNTLQDLLKTTVTGNDMSSRDICKAITEDVALFTEGEEQSDDITVLIIRRT